MAEKRASKHVKIEKELVIASGVTTLEAALPLWDWDRFGMSSGKMYCSLCHTPIMRFVRIRCSSPAGLPFLVIGHQCHEILVQAGTTKEISSVRLRELRPQITQIRRYVKQHIDASALAWLASVRKNLPENLRAELKMIEVVGYASSVAAAEAIVAYVKANRRYNPATLLDERRRLILTDYPGALQDITIGELPGIESLLDEWAVDNAAKQAAEEEEEDREYEARYAELRQLASTGVRVPLKEPEVINDNGVFVNGLGYWRYPSLALEFEFSNSEAGRVAVDMLRDDVKELFGARRWTETLTGALQKTAPVDVELKAFVGELTVSRADLEAWVHLALKHLGRKTPEEKRLVAERKRLKRERQMELRKIEARNEAARFEKLESERNEFAEKIFAEHAARLPHQYFKSVLRRMTNPRTGEFEWGVWHNGKKYVLMRRLSEFYIEGTEVCLEAVRELKSNQVYLVRLTSPRRFLVDHDIPYPAHLRY